MTKNFNEGRIISCRNDPEVSSVESKIFIALRLMLVLFLCWRNAKRLLLAPDYVLRTWSWCIRYCNQNLNRCAIYVCAFSIDQGMIKRPFGRRQIMYEVHDPEVSVSASKIFIAARFMFVLFPSIKQACLLKKHKQHLLNEERFYLIWKRQD